MEFDIFLKMNLGRSIEDDHLPARALVGAARRAACRQSRGSERSAHLAASAEAIFRRARRGSLVEGGGEGCLPASARAEHRGH
jgi:hypothetical protein